MASARLACRPILVCVEPSEPILEACRAGYAVRRGGPWLVREAACALRPGEIVALVGPNGAGKTSLIRLLGGLLPPSQGSIELNGTSLTDMPPSERGRLIGYVEQSGRSAWPMSVANVVALGRLPHEGPGKADHPAVAAALASCDLTRLAERSITSLSGGERTRALVARALAGEPKVLLADEPTAGLDPLHQLHLMEILRALADSGVAVLIASHDLTLAARYCDRIWAMLDARIAEQGSVAEIIASGILEHIYGVQLLQPEGPTPMLVPWQPL